MADLTAYTDDLADVLAHHGDYRVNDGGWTVCICGHVAEGDDDDGSHARHAVEALTPVLARIVVDAKRDALTEAADKWQWGQWADAPRCADRVQERIANAQHVTDWLRARAALGDTTGGGEVHG